MTDQTDNQNPQDDEPAPKPETDQEYAEIYGAEAEEPAETEEPTEAAAEEPEAAPRASGERIAKVMARAGVASRREAERMIVEGRVVVNGEKISSPALDILPTDKVKIDGKPMDEPQETRLWMYYKPVGLVTSESDEKGRQTVFDALPRDLPRVMSVGRLDLNSEGLLLLTNDGELKRRLELPTTGWLRKYRVRVNGQPTDLTFGPLRRGATIDGEEFQPMEIKIDSQKGANAWLTVGIREGRNREIRRAMSHVGLIVNRLIRISYGPFRLTGLEENEVKEVKRRILRDQLGSLLTGEMEDDDAPARPARRGERGGDRGDRRGPDSRRDGPRGDRKPRGDRPEGDFRARPPRGEGDDRRPRFSRDGEGDRKPRSRDGEGYGERRSRDGDGFRERRPRDGEGFGDRRPREGFGDRGPRPPRRDDDGDRKPRFSRRDDERGARPADGDRKPRFPRRDDERGGRPADGDRKPRFPRRDDERGARPADGDRKPRYPRRDDDAPRGDFADRKPRGPRRDGEGDSRPAQRRDSASMGDRKPRWSRDSRPERPEGTEGRPQRAERRFGDRDGGAERKDAPLRRDGDEGGARKSYGSKPGGSRFGSRDGASGDRERSYSRPRSDSDRPAGGKPPRSGAPRGGKPGGKPFGGKPGGGRPSGPRRPKGES